MIVVLQQSRKSNYSYSIVSLDAKISHYHGNSFAIFAPKGDFTRSLLACSLIKHVTAVERWTVQVQRDGTINVAWILHSMKTERIYSQNNKIPDENWGHVLSFTFDSLAIFIVLLAMDSRIDITLATACLNELLC